MRYLIARNEMQERAQVRRDIFFTIIGKTLYPFRPRMAFHVDLQFNVARLKSRIHRAFQMRAIYWSSLRKVAGKKGNPESRAGENRTSITVQLPSDNNRIRNRPSSSPAFGTNVRHARSGGVQCGRLMRRGVYPDDKFELNCTRGEADPVERVARKRLNVVILAATVVVDILEEKGQQLTYGVRAK